MGKKKIKRDKLLHLHTSYLLMTRKFTNYFLCISGMLKFVACVLLFGAVSAKTLTLSRTQVKKNGKTEKRTKTEKAVSAKTLTLNTGKKNRKNGQKKIRQFPQKRSLSAEHR